MGKTCTVIFKKKWEFDIYTKKSEKIDEYFDLAIKQKKAGEHDIHGDTNSNDSGRLGKTTGGIGSVSLFNGILRFVGHLMPKLFS